MKQFLFELGTRGVLKLNPIPGQIVNRKDGFYLDWQGNLWEVFEGVLTNA